MKADARDVHISMDFDEASGVDVRVLMELHANVGVDGAARVATEGMIGYRWAPQSAFGLVWSQTGARS